MSEIMIREIMNNDQPWEFIPKKTVMDDIKDGCKLLLVFGIVIGLSYGFSHFLVEAGLGFHM